MDCADRDRIDEARQELHRIINDRLMKEAIILIFANKQDLPDGRLHFKIACRVVMEAGCEVPAFFFFISSQGYIVPFLFLCSWLVQSTVLN